MKQTLLDRMIGAVSPKAGARRAEWRRYYEEQRGNYDASDSGRLQSRWTTQNLSAELTDRFERDPIRARTRDLERNSDVMNAILRALEGTSSAEPENTGYDRGSGEKQDIGNSLEALV